MAYQQGASRVAPMKERSCRGGARPARPGWTNAQPAARTAVPPSPPAAATRRPRPGRWTRRSATPRVAAHLSTFAGLVVPFGSVIGPLAVWLTRRDRDPSIDQAGREALNFGISIAIYGAVLLVAALMLVGIPLLMVGVIAWVVLAS